MRMPGRFEWKILGVVLLVAALSAGTAAYALRYALRSFVGYWQQEREGADAAAHAADVFRAYFIDRKDEFRRRTRALARRGPARMADLAGTDGLLRARLLEGETVVDEWPNENEEGPPDAQLRWREGPPFLEELPRAPGEGPAAPRRFLELTFGIPMQMYDEFLALTASLDHERQRDQALEVYVSRFIRDYLVFVGSLLAVVPLVGLFFARRATSRVARLRDAAQRVGEGDLSVRLRPGGRDELDELARAFDGMVGELEEARSRLEYLQKVSAWQEVARRLAHEIKNPLTPIQLAVQELATKYRGDDPAYRRLLDTAVEILKEEIGSLRRLVEDFSAFAKLPKIEPASLELGSFLQEFGRHHPEWQPYLEVRPPEGEVTVSGDRMLFGRVLANLVENAVQAAEGANGGSGGSGGSGQAGAGAPAPARVRLSVEARLARRRAVIVIEDNGPGVPAADRQRIFDPYVTSKAHGTGLGLAIVRKIVIDHGGDVTVAGAPSALGGARFEVEIPLA